MNNVIMRTCKKCKENKEISLFATVNEIKNGKSYSHIKYTCRSCINMYNRTYTKINKLKIYKYRRKYFNKIKESCSDSYVKLLLATSLNMSRKEIIPEMIAIKRNILYLYGQQRGKKDKKKST